MALFEPDEWAFTENAVDLVTTNPFDPGWVEKGRRLLGLSFPDKGDVIAYTPGATLWWGPRSVYSEELHQQIVGVGERLCQRLRDGEPATEEEWRRYELVALYCLYCEYGPGMDRFIDDAVRGRANGAGQSRTSREKGRPRVVEAMWDGFRSGYEARFPFGHLRFPRTHEPEHVFACFFAFRRAFYHIFFNIVGTSKKIAELRCAVWESIFTHDFMGWMQGLHPRMKDIPTLVTGLSGTGKERVAEAISRSQYIPFDPKKGFADFLEAFQTVNLSALSPLLIESELFGHVKGAFTGAIDDRVGRLEQCPLHGALFLDEIGEVTMGIQVKLLRVLNDRCFQRVGASENVAFRGKIIAATNRDLAAEMQAGRFREDFYYRLYADTIETPSLREQLDDRPEDLPVMVEFVCRSVVGEEKAPQLAPEVVGWIGQHLRGYAWPGNFRELEQCVRSYTIRKEYHPLRPAQPRADDGSQQPPCDPVGEACETLATAVLKVKATCADKIELKKKRVFDRIKRCLFTLVRARTLTKEDAATLLGIDVRTLDAGMRATDCLPVDG